MAGGGGADTQYVNSKTSVWWDIENCTVPSDCDPHAIAQNISSALTKMNYCGPVSISAYGDTHGINSAAQQALSSTGVSLNHVPAGVKDASDKKILVDMLFWAVDNPAPANYFLISGDRDFSNALHQLRMRRYNILLAQPKTASAPLVAAAKSVWLWTSLLVGGRPLAEGELQQPGSKNYTSSPGTAQIPVSGAAQMKEPVDSCSAKPHVANQNSPSTARGNRWGGIQGNPSQTNTPFYPSAPPPMPAGLNGTSFTRVPGFGSLNESTRRNPCQMNESNTTSTPLDPSAPPPMSARPNGTSSTSASSTRVADFDSLNNFGHTINASPQRRNPELKHDPKSKPDSKNKKKLKGENSKEFCVGKGTEISPNKKEVDGKNSKGFCAGKGSGPSQCNKKPEGENSKGSCEGKGQELKHDPQKKRRRKKKKPEGENSKKSCEGKGSEIKHDPQKKSGSENKKKLEGGNSKGSCEGTGPEIEHDPENWANLSMGSTTQSQPPGQSSIAGTAATTMPAESNPHVSPAPVASSSSSSKNTVEAVKDVIGKWGKMAAEATKKAEDLAGNMWQHLKTGPSFADAAVGRIAQGTKAIAVGYEKIFQQTFETFPEEKLVKTFACYLSTSAGPVMGVLYLSTAKLAFCSDNPLSYKVGEKTEWSYYKVVIPLHQLKAVNPSTSKVNSAEKYIQIISVDNHEFWLMGFVYYDNAVKSLQQALQHPAP